MSAKNTRVFTGYKDSYGNKIYEGDEVSIAVVLPNFRAFVEATSIVTYDSKVRDFTIRPSSVYRELRDIHTLKLDGSEEYTILTKGQPKESNTFADLTL